MTSLRVRTAASACALPRAWTPFVCTSDSSVSVEMVSVSQADSSVRVETSVSQTDSSVRVEMSVSQTDSSVRIDVVVFLLDLTKSRTVNG